MKDSKFNPLSTGLETNLFTRKDELPFEAGLFVKGSFFGRSVKVSVTGRHIDGHSIAGLSHGIGHALVVHVGHTLVAVAAHRVWGIHELLHIFVLDACFA